MPDARNLRSNELEGRLRQLHPADELGYKISFTGKAPRTAGAIRPGALGSLSYKAALTRMDWRERLRWRQSAAGRCRGSLNPSPPDGAWTRISSLRLPQPAP
jgi:hypothetical protein